MNNQMTKEQFSELINAFNIAGQVTIDKLEIEYGLPDLIMLDDIRIPVERTNEETVTMQISFKRHVTLMY